MSTSTYTLAKQGPKLNKGCYWTQGVKCCHIANSFITKPISISTQGVKPQNKKCHSIYFPSLAAFDASLEL